MPPWRYDTDGTKRPTDWEVLRLAINRQDSEDFEGFLERAWPIIDPGGVLTWAQRECLRYSVSAFDSFRP